jgi:hypothetical protein
MNNVQENSRPMAGGIIGVQFLGRNKYINLALRFGRVSNIETIKYAHEFRQNHSRALAIRSN